MLALVLPSHNWDGIPYAAAAKRFDIPDKVELHAFIYEELQESVPEQAYQDMLKGEYRLVVSQDPESLDQVMLFYEIRAAYITLIYLLSRLGVNIFPATHIVSAVAVFIGLWIFFLAIRKHIENYLLLVLPFFAVGLGVFQVAQLSTPDGLAFLCIAIFFALLLKEHAAILVILPFSILVRTDLIIFVSLILGYLFVTHRQWRLWTAVSAAAVIAIFLGSNQVFDYPGYGALFVTAFVTNLNYPLQNEFVITWVHYAKALRQGLINILAEK
ncbi:MAG: hypothetical protein R3293_15080, partial [Candidatus Promineifilaceae bacterium]|nr:hypothetical protein [Candidatus Promineifilaceae bacterium]